MKEENPDATFGELGKLIGEKWHQLSEADKAPYQEKADEAKKQYQVCSFSLLFVSLSPSSSLPFLFVMILWS